MGDRDAEEIIPVESSRASKPKGNGFYLCVTKNVADFAGANNCRFLGLGSVAMLPCRPFQDDTASQFMHRQ